MVSAAINTIHTSFLVIFINIQIADDLFFGVQTKLISKHLHLTPSLMVRDASRLLNQEKFHLLIVDLEYLRNTRQVDWISGVRRISLEMLMESIGQIITTDFFMEHIWGWDSPVEVNVVWVTISNLRKKLTALKAPLQIRAVRGVGYILEELP